MAATGFPASCFGKLPSFADFVRHNAGNREMLAFDQWLQQGLLAAKAQFRHSWEADYDDAPAQHFLFYSASAEHWLAGVFVPSRDKSMRRYPFWVSWQIDQTRLGEILPSQVPAALASRCGQARQLVQEARQGLEMNEIAHHLASLSLSTPQDFALDIRQYQSYLNSKICGSFWKLLFGESGDLKKYLLFKNLCEILLPYRQGTLHELALGLRFPLAAEAPAAAYEASFWIQASLELARNPGFAPVYFWSLPAAGKKARLFLFFRTPAAKNFVHLLRPDLASDSICELEEEGRDKIESAEQALPSLYRGLLQRPELTLKEFLQRL